MRERESLYVERTKECLLHYLDGVLENTIGSYRRSSLLYIYIRVERYVKSSVEDNLTCIYGTQAAPVIK